MTDERDESPEGAAKPASESKPAADAEPKPTDAEPAAETTPVATTKSFVESTATSESRPTAGTESKSAVAKPAPDSSATPETNPTADTASTPVATATPDRRRDDDDARPTPASRAAAKTAPTRKPPPDQWDAVVSWTFAHGAPVFLALLTIGCGFMYGRLFFGEIAGDDLTFHMAESARISDCLRAGDFDLWNPSGNAGYASAYYYQVLPQLFSAVPAALFGHLLFWFQLSNWIPLVFAPAASYRGMRLLGASPWQAVIGAGCVAMMNGESRWGAGAAGSFHVGLYTQTWALAAFPLALGYGARWITKGEKLAPAIFWGVFCGLCHPFAVVGIGLGLVVTVAFQFLLAPLDYLFRYLGDLLLPITPETRPTDFFERMRYDIAVRWKTLPAEGRFRFPAREYRWKLPGWVAWIARFEQVWRLVVLGLAMLVAFMPLWLPLAVDYVGFGGFPHRVNDEVGPGFKTLLDWHFSGKILDYAPPFKESGYTRWPILTYLFIPVVLFARGPYLRWLLTPALFYAVLLGLGPHLGATQDDLFPMVRFLGAMQTVMALAIGAGVVGVGMWLWRAVDDSYAYVFRTVLAAIAAGLCVLVGVHGVRAQVNLVHVMPEWENQHHDELLQVASYLENQPQGRKQVANGAENHWWNLLTYIYGRTPSLLQMGGGGLQASPNYDYLWYAVTQWHELAKTAWVYDAPYLVFVKSAADKVPPGEELLTTLAKKAVPVDPDHTIALWPRLAAIDAPGSYMIRRLPSAGLVSPVQITGVLPPGNRKGEPGREAALAWLRSDGPLADHVLAYDGFGPEGEVPSGRTLKAWRQMSPGDDPDIVGQVEVDNPTTFVFRESWHPRWHAYIDGNEVPIRRVTPDFPAIDVPPGHHEITLRFERPWWAWASWLVWPGTALLAWLVTRRLARSRLPVARVVP